ncbi:hypothetical protein GGR53DRAFT_461361 [Hypoxylon sp. FL1150]|nr:hypothetical protein GGR53DRAFT_461361 [Hypoxylon sp. FL1150]
MSAASKDTQLTPVKNGKRKAESELIDLTGNDTVSTPSPLKKAKATVKSETPSQRSRKTLTPKSNASKTSVTPKRTSSSALTRTTPTRASTSRFVPHIPAGDDYAEFIGGYDDFGSASDGPRITLRDLAECGYPFGNFARVSRRPREEYRPLRILNGGYTVTAPSIARQLGSAAATAAAATELSLVLSVYWEELWGKFELGVVNGVLYLAQKPKHSGATLYDFKWRGRHHDGRLFAGDDNGGTIKFLGDGRVKCCLKLRSGEEVSFDGNRIPQEDMTSPIHAKELESEWGRYV